MRNLQQQDRLNTQLQELLEKAPLRPRPSRPHPQDGPAECRRSRLCQDAAKDTRPVETCEVPDIPLLSQDVEQEDDTLVKVVQKANRRQVLDDHVGPRPGPPPPAPR